MMPSRPTTITVEAGTQPSVNPPLSQDVPASAPDRHARGRERRRNNVYAAAISLFMEKGFEDTTMDDIAERADVARTSVFNYFARKTVILDEWGFRRRQEVDRRMRAASEHDGSVGEELKRYMFALGEVNAATRAETVIIMDACLKWNNVLLSPPLAPEMTAVLDRARDRGEVRTEIDTAYAGLFLSAGYFSALALWIDVEPEPFDIRTHLLMLVDVVLNGMAVKRAN